MKKFVGILIVLLFLPFVQAEVENYNNVSILTTQVIISSSLKQSSGTIQEISASLNFFPKDYTFQTLLSQDFLSRPEANIDQTSDEVTYTWQETSSLYDFSIDSTVETENYFVQIPEKVFYPASVPEEIQIYTVPTNIIDITPEIDSLAEEIVGGEDDMYTIVFLLANWTQSNIAYNLSTLNVEANEKSSYVLEHKEGVCDELTNLFISLARSRGIPARFISGIVYSNTDYTFGPHGWAEVYIDNEWIPVDVTFGTFGWVDPSHIKFKEELGSNSASLSYSARGNDFEIDADEMTIDAQVIAAEGVAETYVTMEIIPLENYVGPGSYVPIQILVTNNNPFYVPVKLSLNKAPGVVGSHSKSVLLGPKEEKSVFWILQVPEDFDTHYEYITLIEVQTMYGGSAQSEFTYGTPYAIISQEDAEASIASLIIDENKEYLKDVSLSCFLDKDYYYQNESAVLHCDIEGDIEDASLCFGQDCVPASSEVQWAIDLQDYTSQRLFVSAEKEGKARYSYFDLQIIKDPHLRIENLEPESIDFGEEGTLEFDLLTDSPVENIMVTIDSLGTFTLSSLSGEKHITLSFEGKDVFMEEIVFILDYSDTLGTSYHTEYIEPITVGNIPWHYHLLSYIISLFP